MIGKKLKNIDWKNLVEAAKKNAKAKMKFYSADESFYIGDVVSHKRFGLGYVQFSFGNKIEVLFKDKVRVLVHRVMF